MFTYLRLLLSRRHEEPEPLLESAQDSCKHMSFIQLKLLLWKNAVLTVRKPWLTVLQIVLPLVLFLIIVLVRLKLPPINVADKYYYAKPMPSAGYVPFAQSLLCDPISGRPEIRAQRGSPYKSYKGASIYPVISLVDATVQLTDTYSTLTSYHTTLLRDVFNITDPEDTEAVKESIAKVWDDGIVTLLDDSTLVQRALDDVIGSAGDVIGSADDVIAKRDLSDFVTEPYEEEGPPNYVLDEDDNDRVPGTDHSILDILKSRGSDDFLNPLKAGKAARALLDKAELDPETRAQAEKSLQIMTREYLKHKYLEQKKRGKRDLSDFVTEPYEEEGPPNYVPEEDDNDPVPSTDQSVLDILKSHGSNFLNPAKAAKAAKALANQEELDPETRAQAEKSLEIMSREYLKHKYLEQKTGHAEQDVYDHTTNLRQYLCTDVKLVQADPGVAEICNFMEKKGRATFESAEMNILSVQLMKMSQKTSQRSKIVKLDLQTLQKSNKTKYIQGLLCGRDPKTVAVSDQESRTLDVKLKLLSGFKHAKLTYYPDTEPVREIIKKMNATFETAVSLRTFSTHWITSAPKLKRCIRQMDEVSSVQEVMKQVLSCYEKDRDLLPVELQPWADKFAWQQKVLEGIIKVVESFDDTANYDALLQLHPVLQTRLSTSQLSKDIDLLTDHLKMYLHNTDDIDFDVFLPFNSTEEMEQWIKVTPSVVWAGIVFGNVNRTLPPHVQYTLRMNGKVKVGTGEITERFWSANPLNGFSHRRYEWSGFVFLQDIIDRAIISLQSDRAGISPSEVLPASYIQQEPYPCHTWDPFLKNSVTILPMALCVSFIYNVCVIVRNIVHEKETRIREAMQQMGLSNTVHWCSWFLTSLLQMSLTSTILVGMLYMGNVFRHSSPLLIWVFVHVGSMATISLCFLQSVFFSDAKLAAAGSGLLYIVLYLPYTLISQGDGGVGVLGKSVVSIFSSSALGMGMEYILRLEEQGVGLQWGTLTSGVYPTDEYNMARCCVALLCDSLVYFLLALYIEGVFPGRYGVPKPWYFPVKYLYWHKHPTPTRHRYSSAFELNDQAPEVERAAEHLSCGISITQLSKKYGGMKEYALNNLSIELYENQILTLLGHNGAGKTTTMSLLAGLYPPTSGTATVYGKDIRKDMKMIRQDLGVCPQFNVLLDYLTVEEHLWFFASLKGTPGSQVREQVEEFMKSVGIDDKAGSYAGELSGGMRRKLCVAMAFVGGSRLIILDEPTAGVDPWSRRSIWEMVLKHKQDRTILLSTHHMDEADLLGDRVAILSHGKLLCCGSPLYLKSRYGPGYYLNIVKNTGSTEVMPDLEDSGIAGESFSDQKSEKSDVPSMKEEKINPFDLLETTRLIRRYVPRASIHYHNDLEISYLLPWEAFQGGVFPDLFREVDLSQGDLGIRCYGVMDSTLEEVFLSVSDSDKPKAGPKLSTPLLNKTETSPLLLADPEYVEDTSDDVYAADEDEEPQNEELTNLLPLSKQNIPPSSAARQITAQLLKRLHHTRRDWRGLVFQIILPAVFVSLAMILSVARPHMDSTKKLALTVDMFKTPYYVPFSDNSTPGRPPSRLTELVGYPAGPWAPDIDAEIMALHNFTTPRRTQEMEFPWQHYYNNPIGSCGNPEYPKIPSLLQFRSISGYTLQNLTGWNIERFLVQTNLRYVFQRYGGLTFGETHNDLKKYGPSNWSDSNLPGWGLYNPSTVKAWHSYRGTHALPTYLSAANNLVLRAALPARWDNISQYGITVSTHPLHNNGSFTELWELMDEESYDLIISIFIIIALSFVPASFVLFLVNEKCSGLYLLQCIAGSRTVPYWLSNYIWDMASFTVANAGCLLVIVVFHSPAFSTPDNIPAIAVLFLLYSWSITPLMYICSRVFSEANNAYVIMICVNTFCGITTTLTTFLIEFLAPNDIGMVSFNNILKYTFLVLPNYGLGRGIMDLAANRFINDIKTVYGYPAVSPWEWDIIGRNLVFMAGTGFVYILILCVISIPWKGKRRNVPDVNKDLEDDDVRAERQRTIYSYAYNDILKIQNLCKVYKKRHIAVNRLAFSVSPGECFGLLGINGAGKTTTFKMLTGQLAASNGDAVVTQISLSHQISSARRQMGYCPQQDALLPTLTTYETLAFFARLKGIPESQIENMTRQIVRTVGLSNWSSRPCGSYSGGNKRKLSAAITLIGEPRLVLLDEPTAGMDPGARRALWAVIQAQKRRGKAVVITSHSMVECETLCSRIGIMVAGRLRCLGSPQHLRDRYGDGYVIQLKLNPQQFNLGKVKEYMVLHLPHSLLTEENYCHLKYEVKQNKMHLADVFTVLQRAKPLLGLLDYAVHQTNLEQVFINFAKSNPDADHIDDELLCLEENVVPPKNLQLSFE